ncbi:MAG TPA: ribose-phosphate diphosphokinase [Candidatus Bathyarchaeia archaeon]|nr:ribose-phosphate diphosphokinase [Candidatus Bathyarchaeia archaeon]
MTTVISGPGQPMIGKQLADLLKVNHIEVHHKVFPDGERDLVFSSEACDTKTIIVQSITRPQDSNFLSLLQIAYTAKEFGAKEISLITPYLAYSAKDRRILKGEIVSIFNIFKMIEATPAKRLFVLDIHNPEVLKGKEKFYHNFSAMSTFGEYYKKLNLNDPLVLAPDFGAKERVSVIGNVLNAETDFFEKKRNPVSGETNLIPHELPVKNRDVIIADEVIRTGGTIAKAVAVLHEMNVGKVYVASTHMMLTNDADKRILAAGAEELIGTDSLPSEYSKIPVAPLIYKELQK